MMRLFLPDLPPGSRAQYFKGTIHFSPDSSITIYITKFSCLKFTVHENKTGHKQNNVIYGYIKGMQRNIEHVSNYIVFEHGAKQQIKKIVIKNKIIRTDDSIIMLYDYNKVRYSEVLDIDDESFATLQQLIQSQNQESNNNLPYKPLIESPKWLGPSMSAQHVINYWNLIYWIIETITRHKKIKARHINLFVSILADVILGWLVLHMFTQDSKEIISSLMGTLEKFVNSLYSLLKWLMGAPAGLKLNNAFNQMLGKYFSYHIQLWWLFLDVSGGKLHIVLDIYKYVGYLGVTFQAAMIADMICVATFHSYCIYVYAARLFNIQVAGLIALLRLFVGRKYNPLRGVIDSCEYTNQELFVGTVAFTILLLLLPTTIMYYIVFTVVRLLSLMVQYVLSKLILFIQTLPLYVVGLWLTNSPKVAGNILIEVIDNEKSRPLVLRVKVLSQPIGVLISNFKPPVQPSKKVEWVEVLYNVFTGKQII